MNILTEREAEDFLEKKGFKVVKREYVSKGGDIENAVRKIGFPLVMKVSGGKIIHKKKVKGVIKDIDDDKKASESFKKLCKIKGAEGVVIQKQLIGKEFLIGVKKTPEFGNAVGFGIGGSRVEELGRVRFRICPFNEKEAQDLVKEVIKQRNRVLEKNILRVCKLIKNYQKIKELDINPLFITGNNGLIADARIVFD